MIGLILNELLTNTTKYAFDSFKPENQLNIKCSKKNDGLELIIQDNGKGYNKNQLKNKKSLGIELVNEMIEQINGTIHINSSNGTENIINIPL